MPSATFLAITKKVQKVAKMVKIWQCRSVTLAPTYLDGIYNNSYLVNVVNGVSADYRRVIAAAAVIQFSHFFSFVVIITVFRPLFGPEVFVRCQSFGLMAFRGVPFSCPGFLFHVAETFSSLTHYRQTIVL